MPEERPKRVEFTVSDELWARLESARGYEPRASFVKRALESALRSDPRCSQGHPISRAPVQGAVDLGRPENAHIRSQVARTMATGRSW